MPQLKLKLRLQEAKALILLFCGWFLAKFSRKEKNLWLFSERGTDARDNGYWMFRYVKENHPKINAKYIISKDSPDRSRLEQWEDDLIEYESSEHRRILWQANVLISTHKFGYCPNLVRLVPFLHRFFEAFHKGYCVWLQHGVIIHDHPLSHKEHFNIDLFICGAYPEYNFIYNTFGHPEGVVKYTGLARFDKLHDIETKRNQILLMPTWRKWLQESVFSQTDYYKHFKQLLTNERLHHLLSKKDLRLVFYPHYEIQPYISEFTKLDLPENIIIADKAHYDVQQLLKESALLITDYSSVFFDFAYMKKPIIYFQFDEKRFRKDHYAEGYYDYHNGLGEWTDNIDDLLDTIEILAENNFRMPVRFLKKVREFFPLHDTKNRERIFDAINSLSK